MEEKSPQRSYSNKDLAGTAYSDHCIGVLKYASPKRRFRCRLSALLTERLFLTLRPRG
jgi:hypothetical protein